MGRIVVLGLAIAIGYSIGYRDARHHPEHVLARAVKVVRDTFGAEPRNDVDAMMNRIEGKD